MNLCEAMVDAARSGDVKGVRELLRSNRHAF